MPAFVKTKWQEKRWAKAKKAAAKSIDKPESEWSDKEWATVTTIYKSMKQ